MMRMPGRKFFIPLLILLCYFGGRAWYFTPSVGEAELATDFTAVRADGQTFKLSDLQGKMVLLDFWGSWCGPCRRESPALAKLHEHYSDELTIVSIAIEKDSASWIRARTQDARLWLYQVMDQTTSFKFLGGEVASLYGVKQVPTNFLIDPEGYVISVNISLSSVYDYVRTERARPSPKE
ncbi:MAG: TlpA disulfide reductase family protein [Bacteroidota bacterium]